MINDPRLDFLKDKYFQKIFSWKVRYFMNEKEDIKNELICRVLEKPDVEWNVYNLSNELNKIISPLKTNRKYMCDSISDQLNDGESNIDLTINNFNKLNTSTVSNKKFYISTKNTSEVEYDDFLYTFIPIFRKILKNEEFLLFIYIYINNEKISDISKSSKLPQLTLTYIHKNLKIKIKDYFDKNPKMLEEFILKK